MLIKFTTEKENVVTEEYRILSKGRARVGFYSTWGDPSAAEIN